MYLKSLEVTGFKSFAKKANLSFTSPITGIVGPNGSGKSNVAEAFKFVLGEQSIKSLRGKRGEDLIWNGGGDGGPGGTSGGAPRANRASARLVFDNTRRIFPSIDFDEVSVERAVNRDNSNEYLLNGSQVRLKDIVELLAAAHIGATGHHIISQGEADRILSASIRERREMIEDALGLKIYQWKKLESQRKLERTEENMKQVESLRREIAPHIKFLKKQVEKIEKAQEMRAELVALCQEYFSIEVRYIRSEKTRLEAELAGPRQESAELERELEKARSVIAASASKDEKSQEILDIERRLAVIRSEKDATVREIGRIEGEINALMRSVDKERDKQKRDEFKTVFLKDVEELVPQIEALKTIAEIVAILRGFLSKHRAVSDSSAIAEAEGEIAALAADKSRHEDKLHGLTGSEAKLTGEYESLKRAIEKEKDTNRDAEKEVFRIIARQNEARGAVAALTAALNTVLHEEETMKRDLGEAASIGGREAVEYDTHEERGKENGGGSAEVREAVDQSREAQQERRHKIERIKIRLEDAGLAGGADVLKEYRETEERDSFLGRELEDLDRAKAELFGLIAELDTRIDLEFKNGILKINDEFSRYFTLMFGGGRAELSVVREPRRKKRSDTDDLASALSPEGLGDGEGTMESEEEEEGPEGLDVSVSLPRKKVKSLMMLSGGERALTSIALLFAISQVNPPPFIILDETDAALDEANSRKYGDMIENLSKNSQLILITHNRETMSRAGVLYGVTMGGDGASKLLSIAFEDAVKVAK